MRIIAGKYKAKKLMGPKNIKTRPTLDRVKEALFSILTPYLDDAYVLDLFSGTGSLGIESISRGAKFAWLNDKEISSISTIMSNIKLTKTQECVKISKRDYKKCLEDIKQEKINFDIIFLDPPYDSNLGIDTLNYISNSKKGELLKEDGIVVYETDKSFIKKNDIEIFNSFENLDCIDKRSYGNVVLMLYKWR